MAFTRVLARDDLWTGEMRGLVVAGRPVLLVDLDGEVHAFEDRCAHQRVKLSQGKLDGWQLTCAAHGWCYDLRTGSAINPVGARLCRVAVRIEDGAVLVDAERLP
jgi:toluene monooxygenase system ferredoxin subunit